MRPGRYEQGVRIDACFNSIGESRFKFGNCRITKFKTDDSIGRQPKSLRGPRLLNPPRSAEIGHIGVGCLAIRHRQQRNRCLAGSLHCDQTPGGKRLVVGMRSDNNG